MVKIGKQKAREDFGEELNEGFKNNNTLYWKEKGTKRNKRRKQYSTKEDGRNNSKMKNFLFRKFDTDEKYKDENKIPRENEIPEEELEQHSTNKEDVLDAVSKIKTGKAPGEDKMEPEMVKWLGTTGMDWIWGHLYKTNKILEDWMRM